VCIARDLFGFKKRRQLFIRANDVAFAIVTVGIANEDPASRIIDDSDASSTPA
jgi:hypothetical protein